MWLEALLVLGCFTGPTSVRSSEFAANTQHKPHGAQIEATVVINGRPGTAREKALILSVLQQTWYRFADEKGPRSDYSRQTLANAHVRSQLRWVKEIIASSADARRDAFELQARWVDQGHALFDPDRRPRSEEKFVFDWATADVKKREVRVERQECAKRDYGGTWLCEGWKTRRIGVMRFSRDGHLASLSFPDWEYVTSFVTTSSLR